MRAVLSMFLISVAVFVVALGGDWVFDPVIPPEAITARPQPTWLQETTLVLRAIKWIAAGVAIVAMFLMLAAWAMLARLPSDP
jgi:hypothetical protein